MPTEIDYQLRIIKSCKNHGGYGKKWSSQHVVGVPDLILAMPKVGMFLMEVKLLKQISPSRKFDRQLDVTEKQRFELEQYERGGGKSVLGIVVRYSSTDVILVVLPWKTERLTDEMLRDPFSHVKWDPKAGGFNMELAMERYMRYGH